MVISRGCMHTIWARPKNRPSSCSNRDGSLRSVPDSFGTAVSRDASRPVDSTIICPGCFDPSAPAVRRWVRADGKRPIMCDGSPASSTDPDTWASYPEVMRSKAGDGYGIMLGDGLACWDFDHVDLTSPPAKALELLPDAIYAEVSSSGHGLHVFVESSESSFRRAGVEFYSRSRFIRMTGRRWPK